MEQPSIAKGSCFTLFAFEIGLSIDLDACERLIPAMGRQTLRHSRRAPQYFQYDYKATATGFTATAIGDLDGDGIPSEFSLEGKVVGGVLEVSPTLLEKNAGE